MTEHVTIDLAAFKVQFPQWVDCADETLELWAELAQCMLCVPTSCKAIAKRLPMLMLAHVLETNNITCTPAPPAEGDAPVETKDGCNCDDGFINEIFATGGKISSVTVDGISASFDNSSANNIVNNVGGRGPFTSWLSSTGYGRMIIALALPRVKGPLIAAPRTTRCSHFGEPVLIHAYLSRGLGNA